MANHKTIIPNHHSLCTMITASTFYTISQRVYYTIIHHSTNTLLNNQLHNQHATHSRQSQINILHEIMFAPPYVYTPLCTSNSVISSICSTNNHTEWSRRRNNLVATQFGREAPPVSHNIQNGAQAPPPPPPVAVAALRTSQAVRRVPQ